MVIQYKTNWPRILRQIGRFLIVVFCLSIAVTVLNYFDHPFKSIAIPDLTVSLLGATLGILLGFRTNSAYARWWEARQLWGALVNSSRSLARQAVAFTRDLPVEQQAAGDQFAHRLVYAQMAFVHSLRCALRKQAPWEEIAPFLDSGVLTRLRGEQNVPAAILQRMGEDTAHAANSGLFSEWRLTRLDSTFTDLANVQGACERIKNTPLPRQYDHYPELFVQGYCVALPFILVDEAKLFTPFITMAIGLVFLILNRIGKNLEDPFENTVYDTPMTALSRTIEINLRQTLGETQLPPPVQPVNGVLW
jgi:ion channel-forming bestrophin family protein